MKINIRTKVLLIMLTAFVSVMAIIIYLPNTYFDAYYKSNKLEDVAEIVTDFARTYLEGIIDTRNEDVVAEIERLSESSNLYIEIFKSQSFVNIFGPTYKFTLKTTYGETVNIHFDKYVLYDDLFEQMTQSVNDTIITGYMINNDTIFPVEMNGYTLDIPSDKYYQFAFKEENKVTVRGSIEELVHPERTEGFIYQSAITDYMIRNLTGTLYDPDIPDLLHYEYLDIETGIEHHMLSYEINTYIATISYNITRDDEEEKYRLQFTQFILVLGIVIIFLVSLVLSRSITNPILKLNEAAKKMAGLDFSIRIPSKNHDEIQTLASSLNAMATKLEDHIEDLEDVNNLLSDELDKEKTFEEVRKKFIADSSHELKTPLGVIRAYTERLQDQLINQSENKEYMLKCTSILLDEVRHMDQLIVKLNELSKIDSPTYVLSHKPITLSPIISDVLGRLEYLIETKELEVGLKITDDNPIYGDESTLSSVLSNLIGNAMNYAPEGSKIDIVYNGEFKISNVCEDITEDELEKIWDRFFRVDPSRSRYSGGSGLGLSIVKSILEKHQFPYGVTYEKGIITFYFKTNSN